jgi:hypothetical protein
MKPQEAPQTQEAPQSPGTMSRGPPCRSKTHSSRTESFNSSEAAVTPVLSNREELAHLYKRAY